ncbi:hypothetical protein HaLaN_23868, partial [Haematococcus lacustris]
MWAARMPTSLATGSLTATLATWTPHRTWCSAVTRATPTATPPLSRGGPWSCCPGATAPPVASPLASPS